MSALRWSAKSIRTLSTELKIQGHNVSHRIVAELLRAMGYSLHANKKTIEGGKHPDRNAQFEHINGKVNSFLADGSPVISVGCDSFGSTWKAAPMLGISIEIAGS